MENLKVIIHNLETNEIMEREMNAEELAQYAIDQANAEKKQQAQEEDEAKKQQARSKLEALGLTAEDLKALGLGGN